MFFGHVSSVIEIFLSGLRKRAPGIDGIGVFLCGIQSERKMPVERFDAETEEKLAVWNSKHV